MLFFFLQKDTNSTKILNDAKNLEKLVSAPFKNNDSTLINPDYVDLASLAIFRLSKYAHMGDEASIQNLVQWERSGSVVECLT